MIVDLGRFETEYNLTEHGNLIDCFKAGLHYLNNSNRLLEIGPGIRPIILQYPPYIRVLVEPSSDYCAVLSRLIGPRESAVVVNQDAFSFLKSLPDKSFDTIVLTDVIEHLDKTDGLVLINELDRVSSSVIGIFTPLGFMPQHFSSMHDTWGFNEVELQTHRSGWLPEDFGTRWKFHVTQRGHYSDDGEEFGAMWAILEKKYAITPEQTLAFSPTFEIDRDSAIFQFAHLNESAEIVSNGYTRLIPHKRIPVEYGSNTFFKGVKLRHKKNGKLRLTIFSYIKLFYFQLTVIKKRKHILFYNLKKLEKLILAKKSI